MKAKHLLLAMTAVAAAGGLWFTQSTWRTHAVHDSNPGVNSTRGYGNNPDSNRDSPLAKGSETGATPRSDPANPGQMLNSLTPLAPPNPSRRFTDFTPEQRVEFARKGHGPGG